MHNINGYKTERAKRQKRASKHRAGKRQAQKKLEVTVYD